MFAWMWTTNMLFTPFPHQDPHWGYSTTNTESIYEDLFHDESSAAIGSILSVATKSFPAACQCHMLGTWLRRLLSSARPLAPFQWIIRIEMSPPCATWEPSDGGGFITVTNADCFFDISEINPNLEYWPNIVYTLWTWRVGKGSNKVCGCQDAT